MAPRMQSQAAPSAAHVQQVVEPAGLLDSIADETHQRYNAGLFAPRTRDELRADADTMYRAGLLKKYLPRDADKWTKEARYAYATNRALIAFLAGAELGLLPMQAVRGIYFVEDQPYPAAKTLVGVIKKASKICEYWVVEEASDTACTIVTKRVGAPKPERLRVTIEQFAKLRDEKNYKGDPKRPPWTLYPSRQLHARCSSWLAGQTYQDLTLGFYAAEEMSSAAWERRYGDLSKAIVQVPAHVIEAEDMPEDLLPEADPVDASAETHVARTVEREEPTGPSVADLQRRIDALGPGDIEAAAAVTAEVRAMPDSAERRGLLRAIAAKVALVQRAPEAQAGNGEEGGP